MKEKCLLRNEDGSVLVIALVMLALLTIMGISATTTSNIELQIASHDEVYTENVYLAEAAAMEAIQRLENIPNPEENPPAGGWLNPNVDQVTENLIINKTYWQPGGAPAQPVGGYDDPNTTYQDTLFLAGSQGIVGGSSLDMGKSNVYGYTIYGRCERKNGVVIVGVGYRKAF